jgi:hypothetical protein
VGTGPTLFFLLFQGNPGITLLNGRFVLTIDSQGNQTPPEIAFLSGLRVCTARASPARMFASGSHG